MTYNGRGFAEDGSRARDSFAENSRGFRGFDGIIVFRLRPIAIVVAAAVVVVIVVRRGRGVVVVVIVFYFESIHLSAQFSTIYEFRPSFTEFPAISHFPSSGQIERRFLFCQKPRLLTLGFSFFLSFFLFLFLLFFEGKE